MGPDEYATREELGLVVKMMFAKFEQQAATISALTELLIAGGILSGEEVRRMVEKLAALPASARAQQAIENLREFAAIRRTAKEYLDPPPDNL